MKVLLIQSVITTSINPKQVNIIQLTKEQFKNIKESSHYVWIIQVCEQNKSSEAFQKAAFVLRGIAKAGIIDCLHEEHCNEIDTDSIITDGKIFIIHRDGFLNDFVNNHDFNLIVKSTMNLIKKQIINQTEIENYNIQFVKFSSSDI